MTDAPAFHLSKYAAAKLVWLAGLGVWMAACYFPAQTWCPTPPGVVPLLPFEPAVPYHPVWVLVYQSVWLAHAAMIWAPACPHIIRRYGRDTIVTYGLAAPFFWFMPTTVNRPEGGDVLYRTLVLAVDGHTNALPSLHAVMASLVVLHLRPLVGGPARLVLVVWWGFLLCSTLATGQHRLLDLMTGTMLALGVHLVLERRPAMSPSRP
jgi:hypothetical protein